MVRRILLLFAAGWMCLASLSAKPGLQRGSLLAYAEAGTIITGESARVTGYADAGNKIHVVAAGPMPPNAVETTAEVNRAFSVEIGPFEQAGDYTLTVIAEREKGADTQRTVVFVKVVDPPPDMEDSFESAYCQALTDAVDASDEAQAAVQSGLDAIPPAAKTIEAGLVAF